MVKKLFSISDEVDAKLRGEKNQSAFVDALLHVYYALSPTDLARQELASMIHETLYPDVIETDPPLPTETTLEEPVTPSPESPQTDAVTESLASGTDDPPAPAPLDNPPTPLVETPTVSEPAQATSEPCEHGVTPPAVCIDCI